MSAPPECYPAKRHSLTQYSSRSPPYPPAGGGTFLSFDFVATPPPDALLAAQFTRVRTPQPVAPFAYVGSSFSVSATPAISRWAQGILSSPSHFTKKLRTAPPCNGCPSRPPELT